MPNLKLYVDRAVWNRHGEAMVAALPELRDLLCRAFAVDAAACQLAAMPVAGLPDQPLANVELAILPRPERTREAITAAAQAIRALVGEVLACHVAVRVTQLDPATYVALK